MFAMHRIIIACEQNGFICKINTVGIVPKVDFGQFCDVTKKKELFLSFNCGPKREHDHLSISFNVL